MNNLSQIYVDLSKAYGRLAIHIDCADKGLVAPALSAAAITTSTNYIRSLIAKVESLIHNLQASSAGAEPHKG